MGNLCPFEVERRVSSYRDRDVQYNEDLKSALQISKNDLKCKRDLNELERLLAERNLKIVDIQGDGNCFFRAMAHRLYGDPEKYKDIRARAVQQERCSKL
jgi:hypothetical protein